MDDPISIAVRKSGLLASGECLTCDVCCRFPEATSPLAPFFSNKEISAAADAGIPRGAFPPGEYGTGHAAMLEEFDSVNRCPAFRPTSNDCAIYAHRPLDCRLYPFMLMYDRKAKSVSLGLDSFCPILARKRTSRALDACAREIAEAVDGPLLRTVVERRGVVTSWKDHIHVLHRLPNLTRHLCRNDLGLARLVPTVRDELLPYFQAQRRGLSHYAFAPIVMWTGVFDLHWRTVGGRLLIFAQGDGDCFMIAPPLGRGDAAQAADEAREIMRALDPDAPSPRIQEADDALAEELASAGWRIRDTRVEYVYDRAELAELKGNRFQKKRALCNRFEREREWQWRPFRAEDLRSAATLYRSWLARRAEARPDEFYMAQAEVSFRTLYGSLCGAEELGLVARALEADGEIAGLTVACPLHDGRSFYVMFEVSDLRVRGAAQFMYRQLCREMDSFTLVNAGSASGLANLERVKESYRPKLRIRSHTLAPIC